MSRLQDVPCLEEKPLDSGLAGSAQNLKQRCRTEKTKVIDAAFFQYFLRFTVGYAFHQFASASFRTFMGLPWCDVSSPFFVPGCQSI